MSSFFLPILLTLCRIPFCFREPTIMEKFVWLLRALSCKLQQMFNELMWSVVYIHIFQLKKVNMFLNHQTFEALKAQLQAPVFERLAHVPAATLCFFCQIHLLASLTLLANIRMHNHQWMNPFKCLGQLSHAHHPRVSKYRFLGEPSYNNSPIYCPCTSAIGQLWSR